MRPRSRISSFWFVFSIECTRILYKFHPREAIEAERRRVAETMPSRRARERRPRRFQPREAGYRRPHDRGGYATGIDPVLDRAKSCPPRSILNFGKLTALAHPQSGIHNNSG